MSNLTAVKHSGSVVLEPRNVTLGVFILILNLLLLVLGASDFRNLLQNFLSKISPITLENQGDSPELSQDLIQTARNSSQEHVAKIFLKIISETKKKPSKLKLGKGIPATTVLILPTDCTQSLLTRTAGLKPLHKFEQTSKYTCSGGKVQQKEQKKKKNKNNNKTRKEKMFVTCTSLKL